MEALFSLSGHLCLIPFRPRSTAYLRLGFTIRSQWLAILQTINLACGANVNTMNPNPVVPNKMMLPPTLALIYLLAMIGLRLVWPGPVLFPPALILAGLPFIVAGGVITLAAEQAFKQARTPVNPLEVPQQLVMTGFYRYTRNPMYLGVVLILGGVWLMLGALSPLAGVLAFVVAADQVYIPYEEGKLLALFGQAYRDYQSRVRRWF